MRIDSEQFQFSASDLANHLVCRHLTSLDLSAMNGMITPEFRNDPSHEVLVKRGMQHEIEYLSHLRKKGYKVLDPDPSLGYGAGIERTIHAMKSGMPVIAQASLNDGNWHGRADVLQRVERPSKLGSWSYEVYDSKLARETKGRTILQLCLYSELVQIIQGEMPHSMHVIVPGRNFEPETFRSQDYLAYYRFIKSRLQNFANTHPVPDTYPEPVDHCMICLWWPVCDTRRRRDDHLSFVAGISKMQINELKKHGILTLTSLASRSAAGSGRSRTMMPQPGRGSAEGYERIRNQARLQLQYRTTGSPVYELLDLEPERGLARLPEPSPADLFLDFESDPFVDSDGLEYLLGYVSINESNKPEYHATWAFDRTDERRMFELFIDKVMHQLDQFPGMHIYHFTQYEPSALKRLAGRYASREDEIDRLLRGGVFVDLYSVVKQSMRASIEKYSLKDLEIFFGFHRSVDLREATQNLRALECALELQNHENITPEISSTVEGYNRDDCISTLRLRDWLEQVRMEQVKAGQRIERPVPQSGDPSEDVDERRQQVLALMARLLEGIPEIEAERTNEQQAVWLLAHMLEWHRREEKATWWEYYRLKDLNDEQRLTERYALSGLQFEVRSGGSDKSPVHKYRFPQQEALIRRGDNLHTSSEAFGEVVSIDDAACTVEIKKKGSTADAHPTSVFVHNRVPTKPLPQSILALASWVADHGIHAPGQYRAARDLLMRNIPRRKPGSPSKLCENGADIVKEARRLAVELKSGILPIQGPPGAGKTYTGARMICALLRDNKKVGITAVSHKVIGKLLDEAMKAAKNERLSFRAIRKAGEDTKAEHPAIVHTTRNEDVLESLQNGDAQIGAGTAWLWARDDFVESVDVLFVDEAGQMSLADVLAVSRSAKNIVLLGDPQQLEQPLQGTHPPGVAVSALQHILKEHKTMPPDSGLFLAETWRLSPGICKFTSELFYEGRLESHDHEGRQKLIGSTKYSEAGLYFIPVEHEGNQNSSEEEALVVADTVHDLMQSAIKWVDLNGQTQLLQLEDILIVAPYNAHVSQLASRLPPKARIGTVDKFQGQEAPVVIYSMATSSPEEAPHGMEFLYSLNRLNVATSRARCMCLLVANPRLFETECKTPRQMQLANAFCRYLELAKVLRF